MIEHNDIRANPIYTPSRSMVVKNKILAKRKERNKPKSGRRGVHYKHVVGGGR